MRPVGGASVNVDALAVSPRVVPPAFLATTRYQRRVAGARPRTVQIIKWDVLSVSVTGAAQTLLRDAACIPHSNDTLVAAPWAFTIAERVRLSLPKYKGHGTVAAVGARTGGRTV